MCNILPNYEACFPQGLFVVCISVILFKTGKIRRIVNDKCNKFTWHEQLGLFLQFFINTHERHCFIIANNTNLFVITIIIVAVFCEKHFFFIQIAIFVKLGYLVFQQRTLFYRTAFTVFIFWLMKSHNWK